MKSCKNLCLGLLVTTLLLYVTAQCLRAGHPEHSQKYPGEYRQANMHMLRFQDALAADRWQDALGLCSERVRAKAAESPSPETFFRETLPLDKILVQEFGCWSCGSNNYGQVINLTKPDAKPVIQWFWAIYRINNTWVIDYPPVKLADYIVQKKVAIQAREEKLKQIRQSLEPKVRGIKTHLTSVSEKFVIGSPMLFRLELINFGTTPVHYQNSGLDYHPLTVLNGSREPVAGHEEPRQIKGRHGELAANSAVILTDKMDLSQNHKITKPGKYYVQFSGTGLEIGEPLPPQEPGRFGEDPGLWPLSFIPVLTQFPSEIIEIEVIDG